MMERAYAINAPWNNYQKIGFRFVFVFFILFIIFLDWSANPLLTHLYYYGPLSTLLDGFISWVGKDLFQIKDVIVSPHDGEHNDRTYIYLLYFAMTILAVGGAIIWSLVDRKRPHYEVPYYWLTTIMRYYLAFTMFLFGLYKFFRIQFPDLGAYTLTETVGDMSPMHLAWAFFGYSHGYNVFMGMAESVGLLLLFRRTTTFGAILTLVALTNVIVVNFSFDVHAKMYPVALFLMTLFLLLKDVKGIAQFFFTGQAISLQVIRAPIFRRRWMNILKAITKILVIGFFLVTHVRNNISYRTNYRSSLTAKSEYSGIYEIDSFILNNDTMSVDDPNMWQQLIIGDEMLEVVRFHGDSIAFISIDADNQKITITGDEVDQQRNMQIIYNELGLSDSTWENMDSLLVARQMASSLDFEKTDEVTLRIKGILESDSVYITAKLRNIDIDDFRLMKRRFHWINEAAYFY